MLGDCDGSSTDPHVVGWDAARCEGTPTPSRAVRAAMGDPQRGPCDSTQPLSVVPGDSTAQGIGASSIEAGYAGSVL